MSETLSIQHGKLGLLFAQSADRWSHDWFFHDANDQKLAKLLTSVEGTPEDEWPTCPPMQDVSQHELESGGAILGVGMAGKSHWSASYSIEANGDSHIIKSDLACLRKQIASGDDDSLQFGSNYEMSEDWEVDSFDETKITLRPTDSSGSKTRIVIQAFTAEGRSTTFKMSERILTIEPNLISQSTVLATRWGFEVSLAEVSS
ncbi:MAG: hypothetical protein AB8B55_14475 [Mariniblastus sp.]